MKDIFTVRINLLRAYLAAYEHTLRVDKDRNIFIDGEKYEHSMRYFVRFFSTEEMLHFVYENIIVPKNFGGYIEEEVMVEYARQDTYREANGRKTPY